MKSIPVYMNDDYKNDHHNTNKSSKKVAKEILATTMMLNMMCPQYITEEEKVKYNNKSEED